MAKESTMQTNFTAGEWSPLLEGHVNLERYPSSCLLMQNLIALKQGPMTRRGGTKHLKEVKTSANDTALIPFEYNVEQSYVIEAGNTYFRFMTSNAAITETAKSITGATVADPVVITTSAAHGYTAGDEVYIDSVGGMTEINGRFFKVGTTTSTTFQLQDIDGNDIDGSAYTTYTSGGTVAQTYEITSPYSSSDLFDANGLPEYQYAQSADVLYIVHGSYETRSLAREGNTDWTVNTMEFVDGPFLPVNTTTTTLTLSGTTGSVTVTASATDGINGNSGFQTTDVGRLIRWKDPAGNWTWLEITARSSTTVVTATIKGDDASAGTATASWRLGVYSDTTGYPTVITFFQDRVLLAGASSYPDRYDLSRTGGYSDTQFLFAPSDADGTVTDDAAINGTLQSGRVNVIEWASSDDKGLVLGTAGAEWIVRPSESNEVLTPSNAKADQFSSLGSASIQPVGIENGTVFIQRARRRIHDIIYSFERDTLKPRDLTLPSEHITRTGVAEIVFQQEPVNVLWARRTDGLLIGYTYYPDENVFGAHRHPMGGTDTEVKSLATVTSSDTSRNELWMIVERTINGTTRKYIEYMTRYYEDDIAKEDAIVMDSTLTYDSTATGTIVGLDHLEGETVKVMVDGNAHPDQTVSSGSITLSNDVTGSTIQVGIGNTWAFKSQRIEGGAKDGVAQGKTKRITRLVVRLLNTLGFEYGTSSSKVDVFDFSNYEAFDESVGLFTGDTPSLAFPDGYNQEGFIYLQSDSVFPATILALMPQVRVYDRG